MTRQIHTDIVATVASLLTVLHAQEERCVTCEGIEVDIQLESLNVGEIMKRNFFETVIPTHSIALSRRLTLVVVSFSCAGIVILLEATLVFARFAGILEA